MKIPFFLLAVLFMFGCSSKVTPYWLVETDSYLAKFKTAKLAGKEQKADLFKQHAVDSAKKGGEIYYLQLIELTDIALDSTLLKEVDFNRYNSLEEIEVYKENSSYKDMLSGKISNIDYLPKPYRSIAKHIKNKNYEEAFNEAKQIDDNLSKLITLGVLARKKETDKEIYREMLKISKLNGYKNVTTSVLRKLITLTEAEKDQRKLILMLQELE